MIEVIGLIFLMIWKQYYYNFDDINRYVIKNNIENSVEIIALLRKIKKNIKIIDFLISIFKLWIFIDIYYLFTRYLYQIYNLKSSILLSFVIYIVLIEFLFTKIFKYKVNKFKRTDDIFKNSLKKQLNFFKVTDNELKQIQEYIDDVIKFENFENNNKEEKEILRSVFDINDTTASEIQTPRTSLYTIDGNTTLRENFTEILEQGFSRIPVYTDSIDNIVGILFLKDILKYVNEDNKDILIIDLIRKAYFIPGTKKITDILQEFKKTQNHIAIIIDEYGGTEGIVTIEDILEEIVGEIRDENDEEEEKFLKISDNVFEISGDNLIEEINDEFHINIPLSEEYDTISGYFLHMLGKIAKKNDVIKTNDYILKIIKVDNVKIERIKIVLLNK